MKRERVGAWMPKKAAVLMKGNQERGRERHRYFGNRDS